MPEEYRENIIIRYDNMPEVSIPTFEDADVDAVYKLICKVKLKQILKSVQNAVHNKHDYVFNLIEIQNMKKD